MAYNNSTPVKTNNAHSDLLAMKENFKVLREHEYGNTAPANPQSGQLWVAGPAPSGGYEAGTVYLRNAANDAWVKLFSYTNAVVRASTLQRGDHTYAADSQASDTYVITLDPEPISGYTTGLALYFKANTINTGAATLNVNALGAKTIKKEYNVDLADGDIKAGQIVCVVYDGTNFQLIGAKQGTDITPFAAGDYEAYQDHTVSSHNTTSYTKLRDVHVPVAGTFRIVFTLAAESGGTVFGRIYKNGSAIGTERSTSNPTYQTYSEDVTLAAGDALQIYSKTNSSSFLVFVGKLTIGVTNTRSFTSNI